MQHVDGLCHHSKSNKGRQILHCTHLGVKSQIITLIETWNRRWLPRAKMWEKQVDIYQKVQLIHSGNLMYSVVIIVNSTVLYTLKLLGD